MPMLFPVHTKNEKNDIQTIVQYLFYQYHVNYKNMLLKKFVTIYMCIIFWQATNYPFPSKILFSESIVISLQKQHTILNIRRDKLQKL